MTCTAQRVSKNTHYVILYNRFLLAWGPWVVSSFDTRVVCVEYETDAFEEVSIATLREGSTCALMCTSSAPLTGGKGIGIQDDPRGNIKWPSRREWHTKLAFHRRGQGVILSTSLVHCFTGLADWNSCKASSTMLRVSPALQTVYSLFLPISRDHGVAPKLLQHGERLVHEQPTTMIPLPRRAQLYPKPFRSQVVDSV